MEIILWFFGIIIVFIAVLELVKKSADKKAVQAEAETKGESKGEDTPRFGLMDIFGAVSIIGLVYFLFFSGFKGINTTQSSSQSGDIYDTAIDAGVPLVDAAKRQVIDDAIKQYQIVERSGNIIDMCVHAGMVKAAYLQANNEGGYKNWSDITSRVCKTAGMPGM